MNFQLYRVRTNYINNEMYHLSLLARHKISLWCHSNFEVSTSYQGASFDKPYTSEIEISKVFFFRGLGLSI